MSNNVIGLPARPENRAAR